MKSDEQRCCAKTQTGLKCKNFKVGKTEFCSKHTFETCSICLNDLKYKWGSTKLETCGHSFCTGCIHTWILEKPTCPYCRASVSKRDLGCAELNSQVYRNIVFREYDFSGVDMDKAEAIIEKCGLNIYLPNFGIREFLSIEKMAEILQNPELCDFFGTLRLIESTHRMKLNRKCPDGLVMYALKFPY